MDPAPGQARGDEDLARGGEPVIILLFKIDSKFLVPGLNRHPYGLFLYGPRIESGVTTNSEPIKVNLI